METMVTDGSDSVTPDVHRLPLDVKPVHYDLSVRTDLDKLEFDGRVSIELNVLRDTSKLVFHSLELDVYDVVVHDHLTGLKEESLSILLDVKTERAIVDLPSKLRKGSTATLNIKFRGQLTGSMTGYYRSTWKNEGKEECYSLTQFEPTSARRAFPCWDEPSLKATFSIALISRMDLVNVSNMDVASEEVYPDAGNNSHWKITRFTKTPPMSTYLVAYANGPFEYIESSYLSPLSGKTRPLRVYATKDNIHQVQFTLDITQKVLPLYEKLFNVEYPLPKLDTLIAHDFDAGAMENWGLITGRTASYCLDPTKAALHAQKYIAAMQSHETAHMWFGNITTMAWWDNLYLNEGFASLMGEVIVMDKLFPEWKIQAEFLTNHLNAALNPDAKLSSHPVEVNSPDSNELMQLFDAMSYSKAASVLRMLSEYLGEDVFLRGVSLYLEKHLYANSVSQDLWDAIGEVAGVDVTEMMQTWTRKTGFPVVSVRETTNSIIVRQDRFLDTGYPEEKDNQTIWSIPLHLAFTGSGGQLEVDRTIVLKEKEMEIPLDTSKPFKLNHGTSTYCRVLYPAERLSMITQQSAQRPSVFSLNDRIGFVYDVFALASAGYTDVSVALNLVLHLGKGEEEFLVWQGMRESLSTLSSLWWEDDNMHILFRDFRKTLYEPLVARLGYDYNDDESPNIKQLRTLAIGSALAGQVPSVVAELRKRFEIAMETGDDSLIVADLEGAIFVAAVRYGGRKEYDIVKNIFENPKSPSTRTSAIVALCNASTPEMLEETFEFILTDVKEQDYLTFISHLSGNRRTKRKVAHFMMDNFDEIYKRCAANFELSMLVLRSFEGLTTKADAEAIEMFFKDKDVSKFDLALRQALDAIASNAAVIERSTSDVKQYLEKVVE